MAKTGMEKKPVFKLRKKKKAEPEIRKETVAEHHKPIYALVSEAWDGSLKVGDAVTTLSLYGLAVPENRRSQRAKRSVSAFLCQMVKQNRARGVPDPGSCYLAYQKLANGGRGSKANITRPEKAALKSLTEIPEAPSQSRQLDQIKPMEALMQVAQHIVEVLNRIAKEMRQANEILQDTQRK
jgi:hypothetical protein